MGKKKDKKKTAADDYQSYPEMKIPQLLFGIAVISIFFLAVSSCAKKNDPPPRSPHLDRGRYTSQR